MFESDDFDLDEDFLKDVGEKEEEYYSQINNLDNLCAEPSPKRQKFDDLQSDLGNITFDNEPDFARNTFKSVGKFLRESDSAEILSRKETPPEICKSSQSRDRDKNVESRRYLALEILRKEASKNEPEPESLSRTSGPLRQIPLGSQRNSHNVNELRGSRQKPSPKMFETPIVDWKSAASPTKKAFTDSPKYHSGPCTTLVRKFPGPAGLLPDSHDSNFAQNLLNNLDEHKTADIVEKLNDPSMSDYCSQNTERLFSVGAWRFMLDDLPADFLKGHEIATIKRSARNNCNNCENSRASFLAGVVQRIDHSVENPRLVLKDLSDSIEATMHRDIPQTHPNILEPGVVILLRNVGLLGFKGSQFAPGLQFHVMIAPKNVLAVYNDKARLVSSSWLESIRVKVYETLDIPDVSEATKTTEDTGQCDVHEADFDSNDTNVIKGSQLNINLFKAAADITEERSTESETDWELIEKSPKYLKAAESRENIATVGSRLLQYRSKDVLTPVVDSDNAKDNNSKANSRRESEASKSRAFGDDLLDSDNDTEDEIISQLDVDSILTSYNSGT